MSLDVDPEILQEEYEEALEKQLGIEVVNKLRAECDEELIDHGGF